MRQIFFLLILVSLFSCKHELERPTWNIDLIFPLIVNEMSIEDVFTSDDFTTTTNDSGFVTLVFQEEIIDANFDSLINLNVRINEESTKLDSVTFSDVSISDTITVGSVINEIPFGPILFPNGSTSTIPSIPGVAQNDTTSIDASEYFETMTLHKGTLIVGLYNGFPTSISNINISLFNAVNQNLIATFDFPFIESGNSVLDSVDIGGMTLDENMVGIIHNMDVEPSIGPVGISYQDAIITTITIHDIGITEATAFFPEQQISEELEEYSFDMEGAELTEIKIKEGIVTINALSTLPDTGRIIYNIPSLKKNGIPFESENIIPPSLNGEMTTITHKFDGYVLDMTGKDGRYGGDTSNTIYTEFFAFIDSTGELVTINQTDSFYSYIDFQLTPEYAKGYLGQDTLFYNTGNLEINAFNKIYSGELDLKNTKITLTIDNYIGADANIVFNHLSVSNDNISIMAGQDQFGEDIIGKIYYIERAIENSSSPPIDPAKTKIILDADNLLEIFPNKINAELDVFLNPNGNQNMTDFLYPDYPIKGLLSAKIPLTFIAKDLILIDTVDINLTNQEEGLEKCFLNIENGFPLDAELRLILLGNNNNILDTLFDNSTIASAKVDNDLIVTEPTTTILESNFNQFEEIKKIIIISNFSTASLDQHVDIYNNYKLHTVLSVKLKK